MILQGAHGFSSLSLPQTSHNYLQVLSTAEILFDDLMFALLPGQGAFVRAQVSVLGTEGQLEGGREAGIGGQRRREIEIDRDWEGGRGGWKREDRGLGLGAWGVVSYWVYGVHKV